MPTESTNPNAVYPTCAGSTKPTDHDLKNRVRVTPKGTDWGCLACGDVLTLPVGIKPDGTPIHPGLTDEARKGTGAKPSLSGRLVQPGQEGR